MLEQTLVQLLLLLGVTVFIILSFQRLGIPPSLGYLLVGVLLGSHTAGPVISNDLIKVVAEFGIVFLLFTIGLSFSMAQIYASRHTILGLGTAQVVLTTLVIGVMAWMLGVPAVAAFVIGAVFAQSSTTIISKQLVEQGEDQTRHGRLGVTLSVFQDITAVPFIIVIPVLAIIATAADEVAGTLGLALLKALLAFVIVYVFGRYLLRPLFHLVAERRSAELFTLTVLFVSLVAAWTTMSLGLSMAFGAFLAGMMLAETEFKHQVDSTIRPFRDVLLGLFFISIGMLIDPAIIPNIWLEALLGTLALLLIKILIVTLIVRLTGADLSTAIRTGLMLAVGGEFGFALLAIALEASVIDPYWAQIALTSVLFSMILAPFLIRYNQQIASWFSRQKTVTVSDEISKQVPEDHATLQNHVVICGYGRIGQVVARMLENESINYVAMDMESSRVKEARLAGQPVYYGDSSEPSVLEAIGIAKARLLIVSHDDLPAALKTLKYARHLNPLLPILVRTRDESRVDELRDAGATEVIPETLEAGLMIGSNALLALKTPMAKVARTIQQQRVNRYPMMRELFLSSVEINDSETTPELLHSVVLTEGSSAIGQHIGDLALSAYKVALTALVRDGKRELTPTQETELQLNDVLVLFGKPEDLRQFESSLTNCATC